jgi:hypothetical protein
MRTGMPNRVRHLHPLRFEEFMIRLGNILTDSRSGYYYPDHVPQGGHEDDRLNWNDFEGESASRRPTEHQYERGKSPK